MLFKPLFSRYRVRASPFQGLEFHMETEAYKYRITLITLLFSDTGYRFFGGGDLSTCVGGKLSTFVLNKN